MESWQKALAATGLEPADPQRLWKLIKTETCMLDDYGIYVTLGRGEDASSLSQERIDIRHACPNRLDDGDKVITDLGEATDRTDFI